MNDFAVIPVTRRRAILVRSAGRRRLERPLEAVARRDAVDDAAEMKGLRGAGHGNEGGLATDTGGRRRDRGHHAENK